MASVHERIAAARDLLVRAGLQPADAAFDAAVLAQRLGIIVARDGASVLVLGMRDCADDRRVVGQRLGCDRQAADIPAEIDESAVVDGASRWTIFRRLVLPMARGGIARRGGCRPSSTGRAPCSIRWPNRPATCWDGSN